MDRLQLSWIITEYEASGTISSQSRRKMIRELSNAMINHLKGEMPKPKIRIQLARAIIGAFDGVFTDITELVSKKNNHGALVDALFYARQKYRGQQLSQSAAAAIEAVLDDVNRDPVEPLSVIQRKLQFLKSVFPLPQQRLQIEDALRLTKVNRREAVLNNDKSVIFKLFFVTPYFVLYDFGLQWPEFQVKLLGRIQLITNVISQIFEEEGKDLDLVRNWSPNMQPFLKIFYLIGRLPCSAGIAINELVKMVNVNKTVFYIANMSNDSNQPFIVVRMSDPPEYIVSFDGLAMILPNQEYPTFAHALDYLYKLHYVFNIEYSPFLRKFFYVLDIALYDMDSNESFNSPTLQRFVTKIKSHLDRESEVE